MRLRLLTGTTLGRLFQRPYPPGELAGFEGAHSTAPLTLCAIADALGSLGSLTSSPLSQPSCIKRPTNDLAKGPFPRNAHRGHGSLEGTGPRRTRCLRPRSWRSRQPPDAPSRHRSVVRPRRTAGRSGLSDLLASASLCVEGSGTTPRHLVVRPDEPGIKSAASRATLLKPPKTPHPAAPEGGR
jgi:hypothetical protein